MSWEISLRAAKAMKKIIFLISFLFPTFCFSYISTLDMVYLVLKNNITEEQKDIRDENVNKICKFNLRPDYDCAHVNLAQAICLSGNRPSYDCTYISIAQAICLHGNRPSYDCQSYINLESAICLSTGRPSYDCPSYIKLPQAICLARGAASYNCPSHITMKDAFEQELKDYSWEWDKFMDQHSKEKWGCRGRTTGQFSSIENCNSKTKSDIFWPGDSI